jgi:hypothetical protein
VGAVLLFSAGYWVLSAHRWFVGPRVQGTAEELAAIEHDLTAPGATTAPPARAE